MFSFPPTFLLSEVFSWSVPTGSTPRINHSSVPSYRSPERVKHVKGMYRSIGVLLHPPMIKSIKSTSLPKCPPNPFHHNIIMHILPTLHMSYGVDKGNLSNNQLLLQLVIILFILMALKYDSGVIL